jgi:hypothetical protein
MTVSAQVADSAVPVVYDDQYIVGHGSGTAFIVNPGDWLIFSGQYVISSSSATFAHWKASGAGIALDRNPAYDWAGRQVVNSAIGIATRGLFRVSANFSGLVNLGVLACPNTTGSGVGAPSGVTGVGAMWVTATPVTVSGGTAAAPVPGVAQVIGSYPSLGVAGTGQLDIRLWPRNADYY